MTTLSNEQLLDCSDMTYEQIERVLKYVASQRQAILKEVREGIIHVSIDYSMSPLGYSREMKKAEDRLMSRQRKALDALEKKYKGGEETSKETV